MPVKPTAVTRTISRILRLTLPFAVTALCLWALQARIELPAPGILGTLIASVGPWHWLGALVATAVSFWALGRYDSVAHRHLGTGFDGPQARGAGMAAIALSQTIGFGLVTGTFARWRLLPGLTPMQALQLSSFVAVTFLTALAAVCGAATLIAPEGPAKWIGALVLLSVAAATVLAFLYPEFGIGKRRFRLPSLAAMLALSFWTLLDATAAGTALWLLLPDTLEVSWSALLVAYFIALGAAVVSSAPGGVGPFELALVALLPGTEAGGLMAGVLAFRLAYFAAPALFSGLVLAFPKLLGEGKEDLPAAKLDPAALPHRRSRSETGIIRQNGGHVLCCGASELALLDSPQSSIALFDPVKGCAAPALKPLQQHARRRNAAACFYKCSARTALRARRQGWQILRIAEEAVLNPAAFTECGASRRQLRRKLRQAEKSGLEIRPAAQHLPLEQMAQVDQAWQQANGRAYGTTMGRFEPGYLQGQRVFLAWEDQAICAFASFHDSEGEWCLDLIRIAPGAPDGTGHALVRAAIGAAAARGLRRLSLAAVPDHKLAPRIDKGLRRFKSSFAPQWEPLYMAAPSWWQMALSAAELIRLVHRPPRLDQANLDDAPMAAPQKDVEENEIAILRTA